ncbi:CrcB family protein [Staphylococcus epidermidis]|nr:CrcB family protein [Staphylococcus epidermidis]
MAANLIGGYLIGVFIALFQSMPQLDPAWKLTIITGFLGALTTFSSYSAEVIGLLQQQRLPRRRPGLACTCSVLVHDVSGLAELWSLAGALSTWHHCALWRQTAPSRMGEIL